MAAINCSSLIIFLFAVLFTISNLGSIQAHEPEAKGGASKVQCKQHIEQALKQYWDDETESGERSAESGQTVEQSVEQPPVTDSGEAVSREEASAENSGEDTTQENVTQEESGEESVENNETKEDTTTENETKETASDEQKSDSANANTAEDLSQDGGTTEDTTIEEPSVEQEASAESEKAVSEPESAEESVENVENETKEDLSNEDASVQNEATAENVSQEGDTAEDVTKEAVASQETEETQESVETTEAVEAVAAALESAEDITKEENVVSEETQESTETAEVVEAVAAALESAEDTTKEDSAESKEDSKSVAEPETVEEKSLETEEEPEPPRSRSHILDILKLYEIGTKEYKADQTLIQSIFRDVKKIYDSSIKPLEQTYKYRGITTRLISDAEIFAKPLVMIMGGKSSGKTSLINYLLGLQSTPWQLKTGFSTSAPHFTVITHGDTYTQLTPTELSADSTFSSLQQFGQGFLEHHMQAFRMPLDILQKMTFVDTPALADNSILHKESGKGIDTEVYQWFIDRSDVIYIVIDVNTFHLTNQLQALLEQLKGRELRFIINKADTVRHSQMILVMGQLLWMLSPLMSSDQPPQVYALTTAPLDSYDVFLDDQEQQWLTDMALQISGAERVESRVASVRRHGVRVRNHAKLIDCYLATLYQSKGLFTFGAGAKTLAKDITENPHQYRVYSGAVSGQPQNISRYDLPDPNVYREFFRTNPLIDFKPLSATCSFFSGCPLDKLDKAIAYELPELVGKYKKLTKSNKK